MVQATDIRATLTQDFCVSQTRLPVITKSTCHVSMCIQCLNIKYIYIYIYISVYNIFNGENISVKIPQLINRNKR